MQAMQRSSTTTSFSTPSRTPAQVPAPLFPLGRQPAAPIPMLPCPLPQRPFTFSFPSQFLNEFMVEQKREAPGSPLPIIATKFAPQPWRFTSASVVEACKASLRRLGLPSMGLYMQHW